MRGRYYIAHSCPNCGIKDEYDMWSGARMSSSAWGHDFCCCSDECGLAFAKKIAGMDKTKKGRRWLRDLWEKLAQESDARMCGEPYYGYDAENIVSSMKYR